MLPRSIEAMVDEQVRRWELEQRRRREAQRRPPPTVTVSRQYGAHGAAMARMVADRLQFRCWDQELVHEMASHAGVPATLIASLDEHRANAVREAVDFFRGGKVVTSGQYLRELLYVIHSLGAHGGAVIVGRGAHYVLDPATILRVRVVSPLDARIANLVRRNGISEAEARAEIARVDEERTAFMRESYGRDIAEPTDYDLVLNTASLTVEGAAEVVVAAVATRFGAR